MPKGVGVDRWGVIYIVDSLFDNIQLFDENGTFLLTVGGRCHDFDDMGMESHTYAPFDGLPRIMAAPIIIVPMSTNHKAGQPPAPRVAGRLWLGSRSAASSAV